VTERAPLPETREAPRRGRVLYFAPHADDDVIGGGGTLCKHAAQGDDVRVVVVFDGRRGDPDEKHDPTEYVARRRAEALAAGAHLGLSDYAFWDYPEGHEPSTEELLTAARGIAAEVADYAPDVVYAPWAGEHHVDHHVLARGVRLGLALAGFGGEALGYEVWTPLVPTLIVDVTDVQARKEAALAEHVTQQDAIEAMSFKALALSGHRAMYLAPEARHGEAFRPLGPPSDADAELAG
jgi:LmbE family N-acetylglucosaminyl deacetylase